MYLLTFVFLVIGILGVYSQVMAVEAARMAASETSMAQQMVAWHSAALSLAENVINPKTANFGFALTPAGCSLTVNLTDPDNGLSYCQTGSGISSNFGTTSAVVGGNTYGFGTYTVTATGVTYPHMDVTYNAGTYSWNSLAYQSGGNYYVLTYVPPPAISAANPAPGFIATASMSMGTTLGITQSDLYQQIQNTGLSIMFYGYVTAPGTLATTASQGAAALTYSVPASVPVHSLGIISVSSICNGC